MDRRREFPDAEVDSWLEREIASCRFDDVRHGKRLGVLLEQLSERIGGSIPFACQDWAATKAAYRFLSNARVDEEKILAGHFRCTRERFAAMKDSSVLDGLSRTEVDAEPIDVTAEVKEAVLAMIWEWEVWEP